LVESVTDAWLPSWVEMPMIFGLNSSLIVNVYPTVLE